MMKDLRAFLFLTNIVHGSITFMLKSRLVIHALKTGLHCVKLIYQQADAYYEPICRFIVIFQITSH